MIPSFHFAISRWAWVLLISLLSLPRYGFGQSLAYAEIYEQVKQSYLTGEIQPGLDALTRLRATPMPQEEQWLEAVLITYYQLLGRCTIEGTCVEGEAWIQQAVDLAENWADEAPQNGRAQAFYAAFLGIKIQFFPSRAMFLGPMSQRLLARAERLSPQEPQVWIEKGNFAYHAPRFFGGGMEQAEACFAKAIDLIESQPDNPKTWLYLHAKVYYAKAAEQNGKLDLARRLYQQLLQVEPGFSWVSQVLLPGVGKKPGE